jgi:hypothetical protein
MSILLKMIPNGQAKAVEVVSQFPSESGHWYCPKTGQQIELPRGTWAKTAIEKGYVPGVTTIIRQVAKPGLERWRIKRAIAIALDLIVDEENSEVSGALFWEADALTEAVWEKLNDERDEVTGRGKELHAAIEQCAQGQDFDPKWDKHVNAVCLAVLNLGFNLMAGNTEHSFATRLYGGKVDWHNGTWLLDFKTKDKLTDDKGKLRKLAHRELAMQLAAYDWGLGAPETGRLDRRCANVFVGVEDCAVHVHEWDAKELTRGWRKFDDLLNFWWEDHEE